MSISAIAPFGVQVNQSVIACANDNPDREICGVVCADHAGMYRFDQLPNTASDPEHHFVIAADQLQGLVGTNGQKQICGVVHSHPHGPAWPSFDDMCQQQASQLCWGICVPRPGPDHGLFWFGHDLRPDLQPDLLRRPYRHGVTDCYALVRDWYRLNRDIILMDRPRHWNWWHKGDDLYSAHFADAGFHILPPDRALRPGDVGLVRLRSAVINHALIWCGDGLVLHHLAGRHGYDPARLPGYDPAERWQRHIIHWLRYGTARRKDPS